MGTFQEKLINNDFELIASELFSGDPRLQLENLKVGFQTTRFISASTRNFLDIVKRFSTQKLAKVSTSLNDIIGRRRFGIVGMSGSSKCVRQFLRDKQFYNYGNKVEKYVK